MVVVLLLSCSYVIVQSLGVGCRCLALTNSPTQPKNREAREKVTRIFMLFFLYTVDITIINQQNTQCSSLQYKILMNIVHFL
jgi:hypothetical protein